MSYPIKDLSSWISEVIIERGEDYWLEGAVDNLANMGNRWEADVYGSDEFPVFAELKKGKIEDWGCDCGGLAKNVSKAAGNVRGVG